MTFFYFFLHVVRVQQIHKSDGAQNRVNGVFFDPKSLFLNYSLNLSVRCFRNCTQSQALKVVKSDCFGYVRKISIMFKMVKWVIFELKINIFQLLSKSLIRDFGIEPDKDQKLYESDCLDF